MNIDLKLVNYKPFAGHDGGMGYNVDLKFNGKKVAHAHDDAWGGGVMYTTIDKEGFDSLLLAIKEKRDEDYSPQVLLEFEICDMLKALDMKKDEKKGILCKHFNGWKIYGWNLSLPKMLERYGIESIQEYYNELKSEGKEVINGEYLKSIGVNL